MGAGRFDAERKRPLTERSGSAVATSGAEAPDGLDWQTFSAAYFPGRRRHDLEALTAYSAYKRSRDTGAGASAQPAGAETGRGATGATRPTELGRRGGRDALTRRAMTRERDQEQLRRDALTAFLDEREREGYRVESHTHTQAIIGPPDRRRTLRGLLRKPGSLPRQVVSVDRDGEVSTGPAEQLRS